MIFEFLAFWGRDRIEYLPLRSWWKLFFRRLSHPTRLIEAEQRATCVVTRASRSRNPGGGV